jgi:hypothetical protein
MWAKFNMIDPYSGLETLHGESLLVSIVSLVSGEEEKVFVLSSYLKLGVGCEPDSSILLWND